MNVSETEFLAALRSPHAPVPEGLTGPDRTSSAGRRFDVYRNNVATSLMDALEQGFPVIARLIGQQNFRNLAREFQWQNPPTSPLMQLYGADFGDFLGTHPALQNLPYLGDVARFEYALRQSYHAADTMPIDPQQLNQSRLEQCCIELAPSVHVFSSDWPVLTIWRFNTEKSAPKPEFKPEHVLITRHDYDPKAELIEAGDAAFLHETQARGSISDALAAAEIAATEFDFGQLLGLLLKSGAITGIKEKDD